MMLILPRKLGERLRTQKLCGLPLSNLYTLMTVILWMPRGREVALGFGIVF
jgi:hypothetical protein